MDGRNFDALTTTLVEQRSRRGFSRLLAGGALGALAAVALREAGDAKAKNGQHPASGKSATAKHAKNDSGPAASDGNGSVGASAKRKRRCRSSQALCYRSGQC